MRATSFHRPRTTAEALALLERGDAAPIAGGTDVFPAMIDKPPPTGMVDLSGLAELRGVSIESEFLRMGAATTWSEIARTSLPSGFDMLRQAALQVGGAQIQNRATIAGNLCNASPAADGAPPLLALDAQVELVSPRGLRALPLDQFLVGNRRTARSADEIMTAILVPRAHENARSAFLKLGARRYLVISIVMVAALLDMDAGRRIRAARIAVGAASPVARRLRRLEQRLVGREADRTLADDLSPDDFEDLSPIDDLRATAEYRRDAAAELVARALRQLVDGGHG